MFGYIPVWHNRAEVAHLIILLTKSFAVVLFVYAAWKHSCIQVHLHGVHFWRDGRMYCQRACPGRLRLQCSFSVKDPWWCPPVAVFWSNLGSLLLAQDTPGCWKGESHHPVRGDARDLDRLMLRAHAFHSLDTSSFALGWVHVEVATAKKIQASCNEYSCVYQCVVRSGGSAGSRSDWNCTGRKSSW